MRYAFLIISLFFLSALQAQPIPDDSPVHTENQERIITYSLGANNDTIGKNIWEYSGSIVDWVYLSYQNEKWIFRAKSQRTYDDRGNLLSNVYMEFNENRWVNRYLDLYSYDAKNNKTESLLLECKKKKWVTMQGKRGTFKYSDNKLIEISYELWNRDGWISDWRTEFIYKEEILVCSYDYEKVNSNWKLIYKNDYDWFKWRGEVAASLLRSLNSYEEQDGNWVITKRPHSKRNSSFLITYN